MNSKDMITIILPKTFIKCNLFSEKKSTETEILPYLISFDSSFDS